MEMERENAKSLIESMITILTMILEILTVAAMILLALFSAARFILILGGVGPVVLALRKVYMEIKNIYVLCFINDKYKVPS